MKFPSKHRKIFYVPGMISLVLLPILCFLFVVNNSYIKRADQSVDFKLFDSISSTKSENYYKSNIGFVPKRKYKLISFNGINDENKIRLAEKEIKKITDSNDTINGVKYNFGNHVRYQTFITSQDLLFINDIKYTVYKNYIFVFDIALNNNFIQVDRIINPRKCGIYDNDYWQKQDVKLRIEMFAKNLKLFWKIYAALIVLIIINIYSLIKFNRNKFYNQKTYL